jgi:hypothetical protein
MRHRGWWRRTCRLRTAARLCPTIRRCILGCRARRPPAGRHLPLRRAPLLCPWHVPRGRVARRQPSWHRHRGRPAGHGCKLRTDHDHRRQVRNGHRRLRVCEGRHSSRWIMALLIGTRVLVGYGRHARPTAGGRERMKRPAPEAVARATSSPSVGPCMWATSPEAWVVARVGAIRQTDHGVWTRLNLVLPAVRAPIILRSDAGLSRRGRSRRSPLRAGGRRR